uniref:Hypothetical conserved protein n=1 Tax=Acetithermum autotrophicum TaxID=1446466 RepID=H5SR94_ACEAU|nr:hypothetical conserved protein [Candidatus Acetothermum autotrophicum]
MTKLPSVSGSRVVKALEKLGWYVHRQSGGHVILCHPRYLDKLIVVPIHGKKPVKKRTLSRILKDARLTVDEFKELL